MQHAERPLLGVIKSVIDDFVRPSRGESCFEDRGASRGHARRLQATSWRVERTEVNVIEDIADEVNARWQVGARIGEHNPRATGLRYPDAVSEQIR